MRYFLILITLALMAPATAQACGQDTDCVVQGDRTYRLYLPQGAGDAPKGALLFAHGHRGSADGSMRNPALRKLADDLGMVLIALKSGGDDWSLPHRPRAPAQTTNDEVSYVTAVLDDAANRTPIDPDRIILSGFSAGGMMSWDTACAMSQRFAGFVPMSGTFWAPVPDICTTPVTNIIHIHGTADKTVPLEGRGIGGTRQGEVAKALAMYAAYGNFTRQDDHPAPDGLTCTDATNPQGKLLAFCRFDGGHSFSARHLRYGVEMLLALVR